MGSQTSGPVWGLLCTVVIAAVARASPAMTECRPASPAPPAIVSFPPLGDGEIRAAAALKSRLPDDDGSERPLAQAIDRLSQCAAVPIHVCWRALAAEQIDRERPVAIAAKGLTVEQALRRVLREAAGNGARLDFEAREDSIVVSTRDDLDRDCLTRVYPVRDLLHCAAAWRGRRESTMAPWSPTAGCVDQRDPVGDEDQERLLAVIECCVKPDEWGFSGGRGEVRFFGPLMIVYASRTAHAELVSLLENVRAAIRADEEAGSAAATTQPATR